MIGTLDALLLYLTGGKKRAGYDIRLLFQTTPLGMFSDSPGAIYPALARLERRGLLTSEVEPAGRRRRCYARTRAGETALAAWLRTPPDAAARRRPGIVELRYTMIDGVFGAAAAADYLRAEAILHRRELTGIQAFLAGPGAALPAAARDAVLLGERLCATRLAWCEEIVRRGEETDEDALRDGTLG